MALVLTGCVPDDDGAAASPSSPASAGVAAEETGGGSPPPSSTSGPADASAEYVPASLDGPAQNVPKPVMPELAREESREGAQAFLDYWSDAMWYANQTGDTTYVRAIVSESCEVCIDQFNVVEDVYEQGAWFVGGRESILLQESVITPTSDGVYKPIALSDSEGIKLVEQGRVTYEAQPRTGKGDPFPIYLDFDQDAWIYITAANMPGVGVSDE
ncbi:MULTISPECIES: DUF6318 family protein [Kocuria]|uniref:DUF6318 family protein n=1 Tax=Kocuria oceani TaxID=988827 RepID=A0ABV9TLY8_9MICC|nr:MULTISPECIES: DUF6318 family protein [Kocuria]